MAAELPLLILPAPGEPEKRAGKTGGGGAPRVPDRSRQAQRLDPKYVALQQALDARRARLRSEAVGLVPEEVIVLETVGRVEDFIVAVRGIEGLEWLGEIEEEDIPPDDDFFEVDGKGKRTEKFMRGRVFFVLTNHQALSQVLMLWSRWKMDKPLPQGLRKWGDVFAQLRDVRPWSAKDRLTETGILDDWAERLEHNQEAVPCEIELWFRSEPNRRRDAAGRVSGLVAALDGEILQDVTIPEIAYHAILAKLPIGAVRILLDKTAQDAALIQCEQIQFFRAAGQMAGVVVGDERQADSDLADTHAAAALGEPVIALFDGLPLQNHHALAGRLIVDDPDGYEGQYPPSERGKSPSLGASMSDPSCSQMRVRGERRALRQYPSTFSSSIFFAARCAVFSRVTVSSRLLLHRSAS
jgi:hypothetical protein